ncbi:MAG: YncE family protein [Phycisphaerales bacterium]|nr:YncE family protein [Phycisphaerales bacterium]
MVKARRVVGAAVLVASAGSASGQVTIEGARGMSRDVTGLELVRELWSADADAQVVRVVRPATECWGGEAGTGAEAPDINFVGATVDEEGDGPSSVAYTPDGSKIVIAHRESRTLVVWDAATRALVRVISVPGRAQDIAITPDSTRAVVAAVDAAEAYVVDLGTGALLATVPVGNAPGSVVVTPDGTKAAVANMFDGTLSVIDLSTYTETVRVPGLVFSVTFSFSTDGLVDLQYSQVDVIDNGRVANLDRFGDQFQIIDLGTGALASIAVPDQPADMSMNAARTQAAVCHVGTTRRISVVDFASMSVVQTWTTPDDCWGSIAVNPAGTKAAYTILNATKIIDLTTGAISGSLSTATLNDLLQIPGTERVVGVGYNASLIDLSTGSLVRNLNATVSTGIGAMSPTVLETAQCSTTFGEDLLVMTTTSTGGVVANQHTGPAPESDRMSFVALDDDGSEAVGVFRVSDNAALFDVGSASLSGLVPVGLRPMTAALTPDGSKAVVANADSFFSTVIDMGTGTGTNVPMGRRGSIALVSPDGQYGYVPVVADGDGINRIDLTTNTLAGPKVFTGDMGSLGVDLSQVALSPDGTVIALAGSFSDVLSLVDTGTWTLIKHVPVGDFPFGLTFSADGSRIYVTNAFNDTISVVSNAGGASAVLSTLAAPDLPTNIAILPDGTRLYVQNIGSGAGLRVLDASTGATLSTITVPSGEFLAGYKVDPVNGRLLASMGVATTTMGGSIGFSVTESQRLRSLSLADGSFVEEWLDPAHGPRSMNTSGDFSVVGVACSLSEGAVFYDFDPGCPADLSGSSDPNDPAYGVPDGSADASDFFYYLDQFVSGNLAEADLTGSSDPNDPSYGVPDGDLDADDFFYFLDLFVQGC